jgi:hypothetical protein
MRSFKSGLSCNGLQGAWEIESAIQLSYWQNPRPNVNDISSEGNVHGDVEQIAEHVVVLDQVESEVSGGSSWGFELIFGDRR